MTVQAHLTRVVTHVNSHERPRDRKTGRFVFFRLQIQLVVDRVEIDAHEMLRAHLVNAISLCGGGINAKLLLHNASYRGDGQLCLCKRGWVLALEF